jgi:hypothetical protein
MVIALTLVTPLAAQDHLAVELEKYRSEADPVRKARALVRLGVDQIALAWQQLKNGEDVNSLQTLEQYRDEVQQTVADLKATGIDPAAKPAGFKELQISLRENIRRIDDLIFTLPADKRPFFRAVRGDLAKTQNYLIDALFPRLPAQKPKKPNP